MKTKVSFLILIFSCFSLFVNAQLADKSFQTHITEIGALKLSFTEKEYEIFNQPEELLVQGNYIIEGQIVTFTDFKGFLACEKENKGKYEFELEGNKLKMKLIQDKCGGRHVIASCIWEEVEK